MTNKNFSQELPRGGKDEGMCRLISVNHTIQGVMCLKGAQPFWEKRDIVTILPEFRTLLKDEIVVPRFQVFEVISVNKDGTLTLGDVFSDVPSEYVAPVPIDSELVQQIFYDDLLRGRPAGTPPPFEDIYSRPPFMEIIEKRLKDSCIWNKMQKENFKYVHELQHWLVDNYGYSHITINHFWGLRKPVFL